MSDDLSWMHTNPQRCIYSHYTTGLDRGSHHIVISREEVPCMRYLEFIDITRKHIKDERECHVEKDAFQIKSFRVSDHEITVKIERNDNDERHDFKIFDAQFQK